VKKTPFFGQIQITKRFGHYEDRTRDLIQLCEISYFVEVDCHESIHPNYIYPQSLGGDITIVQHHSLLKRYKQEKKCVHMNLNNQQDNI